MFRILKAVLFSMLFVVATNACQKDHDQKSEEQSVGAHYYTWFAFWDWSHHDHYVYVYNRYYEEVNEYWQCWYETNTNSFEDGVSIPENNQKFIKLSEINKHGREVVDGDNRFYVGAALKAVNWEAIDKGRNNSVTWNDTYTDEGDLAEEDVVNAISNMMYKMHAFGYTTNESCPSNDQLKGLGVFR